MSEVTIKARSAAQIAHLQALIQETPGSGTDGVCPVTHHYAPGLYARELFIPAGVVIVGKTHRHAHLNIISKGRIRVVSEFGAREVIAPCSFISEPGIKRAGYALEDTVWTTLHPTDKTDLAAIEAEVIMPDKLITSDVPTEVIP